MQNFTIKVKENWIDRLFGMKRVAQDEEDKLTLENTLVTIDEIFSDAGEYIVPWAEIKMVLEQALNDGVSASVLVDSLKISSYSPEEIRKMEKYIFSVNKRKGQITIEEPLPAIQEEVKIAESEEAHDYDKEYKDKFLKDTVPQKSKDKGEDHDYKGPIEVMLEKSPEPLDTQKDREKELNAMCGKPKKKKKKAQNWNDGVFGVKGEGQLKYKLGLNEGDFIQWVAGVPGIPQDELSEITVTVRYENGYWNLYINENDVPLQTFQFENKPDTIQAAEDFMKLHQTYPIKRDRIAQIEDSPFDQDVTKLKQIPIDVLAHKLGITYKLARLVYMAIGTMTQNELDDAGARYKRRLKGQSAIDKSDLDGGLPIDEDCPYCSGEWDENTKQEYYDMGSVECPHCGELVVERNRKGQLSTEQRIINWLNTNLEDEGVNVWGDGSERTVTYDPKKHLFVEDVYSRGLEGEGTTMYTPEEYFEYYKEDIEEEDSDGLTAKRKAQKGLKVYNERGTPSEIEDSIDKGIDVGTYRTTGRKAQEEVNLTTPPLANEIVDEILSELKEQLNANADALNSLEVRKYLLKKVRTLAQGPSRKAQLSETDPMQMSTGAPTSEIEKIKMTRKEVTEPINVIMTPSIERSKGAGTPIDPTYLAEQIVRGLRYSHYHTAQEGFNHIIRATKDITKEQVGELKELMSQLGYSVEEQKEGIVKTG